MSNEITSVSITSIEQSTSNECQTFGLQIQVFNDKTSGLILSIFDLFINKSTTLEQLLKFYPDDIVSDTTTTRVFRKTFQVNRAVIFPWNFKILTTSGVNLYDENQIEVFPTIWNITNINVTTDINSSGTVSIQTEKALEQSQNLDIEISIDDISYFDTNVISGLSPGTYTLYVRDRFGCKKTANIVVSEEPRFEALNDFKFVSLLNPIPFTEVNSNRASFANRPSYSIDDNYLSKRNKYEFLQTDNLKFQFRSNYDVNLAYLVSCGEVVSNLPVFKKSNNLNQRDNRDARFYFQNGFLYAYFDGTGNIYDNDGNVIGDNNLNGSLLFDQVQGELLSISTLGVIEILEVVSVDGIGQVMKLNYAQPIALTYLKITTYYNADNFEVYEFDLSLAQNVGDYQLILVNQPPNELVDNPFEIATFISEVVSIVDEFSKPMFKFVWKNSENNQFSWDTGIECYNYMPKSFDPEFQPKDENEIYATDTTSFMLESDVFDVFLFVIERVSQITARQLMMIVSNDYLKIDDNFYVKEETPEVFRLGISNAYNVTLTLQLASNYNSNSREGITNSSGVVGDDGLLKIE